MKAAKAKSGSVKFRGTHLVVLLAGLFSCGGYGWHVYSLFRDAQVNMPQPQAEKLIRDIRTFNSHTKRFPQNFIEINDLIWHTQPKPNYGTNGRQARAKNYHYFFTRVDYQTCAIWALPIGPRRHDASSFFLVLTPGWLRTWKGKAVEEGTIGLLPTIPQPDQLAALMMQEQPTRIFNQPVRK